MKLIMENWRSYEKQVLLEQQIRGLTTLWARKFMQIITNSLKNANDEAPVVQTMMASIGREFDGIGAPTFSYILGPYSGTSGRSLSNEFEDGIPVNYSGVNADYRSRNRRAGRKAGIQPIDLAKLVFIASVGQKAEDPPYIVGGSFGSKKVTYKHGDGRTLKPEKTELIVKVKINPLRIPNIGIFRKYLSSIYDEIYETLAHELTHARQSVTTHTDTVNIGDHLEYYTSDHEVEAFARGFYETAKRNNVTFESVVDAEIEKHQQLQGRFIRSLFQKRKEAKRNGDNEEIARIDAKVKVKEELIRDLPQKWKTEIMAYAKKQLPCAQMLDGMPIHPPGCRGPEAAAIAKTSNNQGKPEEAKPEDSFIGSLVSRLLGKRGKKQ